MEFLEAEYTFVVNAIDKDTWECTCPPDEDGNPVDHGTHSSYENVGTFSETISIHAKVPFLKIVKDETKVYERKSVRLQTENNVYNGYAGSPISLDIGYKYIENDYRRTKFNSSIYSINVVADEEAIQKASDKLDYLCDLSPEQQILYFWDKPDEDELIINGQNVKTNTFILRNYNNNKSSRA